MVLDRHRGRTFLRVVFEGGRGRCIAPSKALNNCQESIKHLLWGIFGQNQGRDAPTCSHWDTDLSQTRWTLVTRWDPKPRIIGRQTLS